MFIAFEILLKTYKFNRLSMKVFFLTIKCILIHYYTKLLDGEYAHH